MRDLIKVNTTYSMTAPCEKRTEISALSERKLIEHLLNKYYKCSSFSVSNIMGVLRNDCDITSTELSKHDLLVIISILGQFSKADFEELLKEIPYYD